MKILFGVQGTGNGHITRARMMAKALSKAGVSVDFLFSGRNASDYFSMQEFGQYQTRKGLSFKTSAGELDLLGTLADVDVRQFWRDVKSLDVSGYDLLINDFEPLTAWAAKRHGLPSIAISHQAALTKRIPKAKQSIVDNTLLSYFAPCDVELGVHWYHFDQHIVPPFIPRSDTNITVNSREYLVYLPFEDLDQIVMLLRAFSEYEFFCFHPNAVNKDIGHIHLRSLNKELFWSHMQRATGVIGNAGFELSSEALSMGKKLLVKPLQGQFEQLSNAEMLRRMNFGSALHSLDQELIDDWLGTGLSTQINFPNDATILVDWLLKGEWSNPQQVIAELWNNVVLPPSSLLKVRDMQVFAI